MPPAMMAPGMTLEPQRRDGRRISAAAGARQILLVHYLHRFWGVNSFPPDRSLVCPQISKSKNTCGKAFKTGTVCCSSSSPPNFDDIPSEPFFQELIRKV